MGKYYLEPGKWQVIYAKLKGVGKVRIKDEIRTQRFNDPFSGDGKVRESMFFGYINIYIRISMPNYTCVRIHSMIGFSYDSH